MEVDVSQALHALLTGSIWERKKGGCGWPADSEPLYGGVLKTGFCMLSIQLQPRINDTAATIRRRITTPVPIPERILWDRCFIGIGGCEFISVLR